MRSIVLLFLIFALSSSGISLSQDSLRLIIPIGDSDEISTISISPNGKLVATANIEWTYDGSTPDGATDRNVII